MNEEFVNGLSISMGVAILCGSAAYLIIREFLGGGVLTITTSALIAGLASLVATGIYLKRNSSKKQ